MIKTENKLPVTYYNLLVGQYLKQVHYQILSIIILKEFMKLSLEIIIKM